MGLDSESIECIYVLYFLRLETNIRTLYRRKLGGIQIRLLHVFGLFVSGCNSCVL